MCVCANVRACMCMSACACTRVYASVCVNMFAYITIEKVLWLTSSRPSMAQTSACCAPIRRAGCQQHAPRHEPLQLGLLACCVLTVYTIFSTALPFQRAESSLAFFFNYIFFPFLRGKFVRGKTMKLTHCHCQKRRLTKVHRLSPRTICEPKVRARERRAVQRDCMRDAARECVDKVQSNCPLLHTAKISV